MLKRKFELLDPDILECPICSEPLAPPVYQCPTGHMICAGCWAKINRKKCPSCQKPIGNNRCIAVEKILASLLVSCKNTLYGCPRMLWFITKADHETIFCEYWPFNCVFHSCEFEGSAHSLRLHFKEEHQVQTLQSSDQFTVKPTDDYIFVDDGDDHLFVVHREKQNFLGDKFFCACFGTFPGWLKLAVGINNGPRRHNYTMEMDVFNIQNDDYWKRIFCLSLKVLMASETVSFKGNMTCKECQEWNWIIDGQSLPASHFF